MVYAYGTAERERENVFETHLRIRTLSSLRRKNEKTTDRHFFPRLVKAIDYTL